MLIFNIKLSFSSADHTPDTLILHIAGPEYYFTLLIFVRGRLHTLYWEFLRKTKTT